MTLAVNDAIDHYTAAGAETSFAYTFPIETVVAPTAHFLIVVKEKAGAFTTLVESVDYSVTGAGLPGGGTVVLDTSVFPFGADAGDKFTIYRKNPFERNTDFQTGGDFFAVTVNSQLDYQTQILQDIGRTQDYSIKMPLTQTVKDIDAPLPVALGVWRWNATANGLETTILSPTAASTDIVLDTTPQLGGDLDVNGNKFVTVSNGNVVFEPNGTGVVQVKVGSAATALATIAGTLHVDAQAYNTTIAITEEDFSTYTLPANALSKDNQTLRVTWAFTTAANTESKTVRVYFGSTVIYSRTTTTASEIMLGEAYIARRGASSQVYFTPAQGFDGTFQVVLVSVATEDETLPITLKMTGQNGVATAANIIGQYFKVEAV